MPSTYKAATYAAAALWLESSRTKYKPNPKSGKSYERYSKYENASTIAEALQLGSKPDDLLFDFEHGHLEVQKPFRSQPLDIYAVKDLDELTYTDKVLSRYACRVDKKTKAKAKQIERLQASLVKQRQAMKRLRKLQVAKTSGVQDVDDISDHKGYWESGETWARRSVAQQEAKDILELVSKEGRKVSDLELLRALRLWGFRQNVTRRNVMRPGQDWIFSDTVGVTTSRSGDVLLREESRLYPDFCKLLCQWLKDHLPADLGADFMWTSVNINKNYAGCLHRDSNNTGPSILKAFGDFQGGKLNYFPEDDKSMRLQDLTKLTGAKVNLDVRNGLLLFDGNRAHEVDDFEGERYSLVYFSCARFWKLPDNARSKLVKCGFRFPTRAGIQKLRNVLQPPAGYGGKSADAKSRTRKIQHRRIRQKAFWHWPNNTQQKLNLEKEAAKYWGKRPPRKVNSELPKENGRPKQSLGVTAMDRPWSRNTGPWKATSCLQLGTSLPGHGELELHGHANVVDATETLNAHDSRALKPIQKAGYCVVFSNRTKVYYLMWRDGMRDKACKAFGIGKGEPKVKRYKTSEADA